MASQIMTIQDSIKDSRVRSKRYAKNNREKIESRRLARSLPLNEFCELCPEADKRPATERHHLSHQTGRYWIFMSTCKECHEIAEENQIEVPSKVQPIIYQVNEENELDKFEENNYQSVIDEIAKMRANG